MIQVNSPKHAAERFTIDNCGMSGSLPTDWGTALTDLEALVLSGNDLIGPIPSEYGSMKSLRDLWLNRNFLQGEVPSELGKLSDTLIDLYLQSNGTSLLCCYDAFLF